MNKKAAIVVIIGMLVLVSCEILGPGDGPEPSEIPFRLTDVVITPENPTFADTVRIEVIGEPNPNSAEPGGRRRLHSIVGLLKDFHTHRKILIRSL